MKNSLIIAIGALLIVAGAIGIYYAYSSNDAGSAVAAWAALIGGTLVILFGFGKRASERVERPEHSMVDHAHTEVRALIQSMGMVAVADSKLRDAEITTIARIHEQMLGIRISETEIHEILSEFGPDFDLTSRLTRDRGMISPTMKRIIVQSCHLVMVSDMEIVPQENARIMEIGEALGFSASDVKDLIASAST